MDKIRLGKTEMLVSIVGFGSIPIQRLPEDGALAVIRRCLSLGINFFDTANGYSTSEERIGKVISGRRSSIIIATKSMGKTREEVEKHLSLSLKRLGVDYIDLYQFHGVSDFKSLEIVTAPEGPLTVLEEAKKAGVIRHIGITSHQIDVAKKAVKSGLFETIMFPFNFMAPEAADELLPLAEKHDVGFIAMKPLAGGMIDNASIAVKYLRQFKEVLLIPGIEKITEIEEIVKIADGRGRLTAAERRAMERFKKELGPKFCHRCDYCQPCTQNVPISMVMSAKSFFKRLPTERFIEMVDPGMGKAAACSECGECETRCPYHLPIKETVAEMVRWYTEEKKRIRDQRVSQ